MSSWLKGLGLEILGFRVWDKGIGYRVWDLEIKGLGL